MLAVVCLLIFLPLHTVNIGSKDERYEGLHKYCAHTVNECSKLAVEFSQLSIFGQNNLADEVMVELS